MGNNEIISQCHPAESKTEFENTKYFTIGGKLVHQNDLTAFCKMVESHRGTTYYIKHTRDHNPYDPIRGLNVREHFERASDGEFKLQYKPVSRETFQLYMKFLTTKNENYLRMINNSRI